MEFSGIKGKNVLVTGGSKNLGKAIVKAYLEQGANVVFTWHKDEEKALAACEELKPLAQGYFAQFRADAMIKEEVEATFAFCEENMGKVDILINNACETGKVKCEIKDMTPEFFNREMLGAIKPMYLHTRYLCVQCIHEGRPAHIVNISAREANKLFSTPGLAAFSAGKSGVQQYTRTLANQMAPYGIIINGLIPGLVLDEESAKDPEYAYIYDAAKKGPTGKVAPAEKVAELAVYLGSADADYIIGSNVDITGGCLL